MNGIEFLDDLVAQFIVSDSRYNAAVESELRHMVCEVSRSASEFASLREAVKQRLTYSNYVFHSSIIV